VAGLMELLSSNGLKNILVLIKFAKAKLFRTSYTVQKSKNIFANLFSVGIKYIIMGTPKKDT